MECGSDAIVESAIEMEIRERRGTYWSIVPSRRTFGFVIVVNNARALELCFPVFKPGTFGREVEVPMKTQPASQWEMFCNSRSHAKYMGNVA